MNEAMQLGQDICGKLPTKALEKLGRLGQVLWDSHSPIEGEASTVLTELETRHRLFVYGNKVSFHHQVTEQTYKDTSLLCSWFDNIQERLMHISARDRMSDSEIMREVKLADLVVNACQPPGINCIWFV